MKIENIKILIDSKIQELILSADDSKNLNFIVGDNGSGKTRTFNDIKSYFLKETTESKIEIKTKDGECKNPDLMFANGEDMDSRNLWVNKKFSDIERAKIEVKANEILGKFQKCEGITLRFKNENLIPIKYDGICACLARTEQTMVFLASLFAIREVVEPNLPMILDNPFHMISQRYRLEIMEMLCKNVNQLLVFLTDESFDGTCLEESSDASIPTMQTFVKEKNMLGSLYFLRNNNFEKRD